ncbi:hypothetical protein GCM10010521_43720 [Streptomyces rameus]|uniref:Uncharacterized protein n=1 Tax=Streptomyces rameus TaxID=68261 RepID=A0ABP6NKW9_9ACTN
MLIATALAAGAASGVQDSASQTVRDAYDSLCRRVRDRLGERSSELDSALRHQRVARSFGSTALLSSLLELVEDAEVEVDKGENLCELAKVVLARGGQPNTVITNSQGVYIGPNGNQQNTFNNGL